MANPLLRSFTKVLLNERLSALELGFYKLADSHREKLAMPSYPIILVPRRLNNIQSSQPALPPEPQIRPAPLKPKEPEQPEKPSSPEAPRGRFTRTKLLASAGVIAALTGPLGILVAGGLAGYGAYDATLGYEQRVEEYQRRMQHYKTVELPTWFKATKLWEQEKNRLIEQWQSECIKIKQQWEIEKHRLIEEYTKKCEEILKPENLTQWRKEKIEKAVVVGDLEQSDAREGKQDRLLFNALRKNFPQLEIRRQQKILSPKSNKSYPYTPDVIVHDPSTKIWVDVEVDEPWFWADKLKVPIHYEGKDDARNDFFLDSCWIVVRFTESQVAQYPLACVKCIAEVLDQFRGEDKLAGNLKYIPELPKVPTWNSEAALNIPRE